jgi:ATP-binding cassette, subfamily B, bacterial CvaB/MchF/RaxB
MSRAASLAGALRGARLFELWWRRPPVLLEHDAGESGLACLAMVLGWHGVHTDLRTLRVRHSVATTGMTLAALARVASAEHLNSRSVRLAPGDIAGLRLPCILAWDGGRFVVLSRVDGNGLWILDPAQGERRVPMDEVAQHAGGLALELWPAPTLTPKDERQRVPLSRLLGRVSGAGAVLTRVLMLSLALELFALVSPLMMQWVTDQVLVARDTHLLAVLALGFAMLALLENAITLGRGWVLATAAVSLKLQWHSNVLAHLLALPTAWFQKRHLGDVLSRMRATNAIQSVLTRTLVEATLDGAMAVLALAMMLLYSPTLTAVAVFGVLAYVAVRLAWYKPMRRARQDQIVHEARQASHLLETLRGVRTLKMHGRQRSRLDTWQGLFATELAESLRYQALDLTARTARGVLSGVFGVVILWVGAHQVIAGQLSLGMLLAFLAFRSQFNARVMDLVGNALDVRMLRVDTDRLADIVLSPTEPAAAHGQALAPGADLTLHVDDLSFRYADHEPAVLDRISLTIAPGELVAITGPSGCGKSTLVSLLLGDLQATHGAVRIGRRALDAASVPAWRSVVGTVLQDDTLFAGSVAENIACFDPQPDEAWIAQCVQAVALADDIARMPMGLHTLVGDMGTTLSGGQKQRVLLARALYKRPRLLVLDEATSQLDVARERHVMASLSRLAVTRIVVAHRPETIGAADRVIELQAGRVLFDGPSRTWRARHRQAGDRALV